MNAGFQGYHLPTLKHRVVVLEWQAEGLTSLSDNPEVRTRVEFSSDVHAHSMTRVQVGMHENELMKGCSVLFSFRHLLLTKLGVEMIEVMFAASYFSGTNHRCHQVKSMDAS